MSFAEGLRCRECGRRYPLEPLHVCEFCFGPLEIFYDYQALARTLTRERIERGPPTMWRYADLLPGEADTAVDIGTGMTPLLRAANLGRLLGLNRLYIKNDCQNPTWSFKDRVVSVASSVARQFEFDTLACASTGNLANSVSAHAARAGMKAIVFIPADLEQGKIVGSAVYGPTLVAVDGSYDEVNRLCSELSDKYPWAFVNINVRPYYSEGSKTLAYEVCEQMGWRVRVVAVGGVADGQRFSDGVGLLGADVEALALPGLHDRRAAFGLGPAHASRPPVDEPQPGQLLDPLVDLGEQGAAGHRDDAVVGRPPA